MIQSILYWKMAAFRCVIYMLVVGGGTFLSMTESYSGDDWTNLSTFECARVYATCTSAALGALLAFLDQTMSKLNGGPVKPVEETKPPTQ